LPIIGEHWDKVQNIEKVAESLKNTQGELMKDIKRADKITRRAYYISIAAVVISAIGVIPILHEMFFK
jgi:hypothetical protein